MSNDNIIAVRDENLESLNLTLAPNELNEIKKSLDSYFKKVSTQLLEQRQDIHKAAISCIILAWTDSGNCYYIRNLLDTLRAHRKMVRVEQLQVYFEKVGGFSITAPRSKDGKYNAGYSKLKYSDSGIRFTRDSKHLDICKMEKNKFYNLKLAAKPLKVNEQLCDSFKSAISATAKQYAIGVVTEAELDSYFTVLKEQILNESKSKATVDFVAALRKQKDKADAHDLEDSIDG